MVFARIDNIVVALVFDGLHAMYYTNTILTNTLKWIFYYALKSMRLMARVGKLQKPLAFALL